jgi:hypothetical protein
MYHFPHYENKISITPVNFITFTPFVFPWCTFYTLTAAKVSDINRGRRTNRNSYNTTQYGRRLTTQRFDLRMCKSIKEKAILGLANQDSFSVSIDQDRDIQRLNRHIQGR